MEPIDIVHWRMRNLGILAPAFQTAEEVVRRLVAVQSQEYAGAKWSVGLRIPGAGDAEIEQAYNEGAILRTHLLRPTWHFVTPQDIRWLLALTSPRVHKANASMYRKLGLDERILLHCHAVLRQALQGYAYQTRDQLRAALEGAGIDTGGVQRMAYLMMHAELEGLICSGPRAKHQFTYALLEERAPRAQALGREEALVELAERYFASRGPASVQDFAKWSGLTLAECRAGLDAARGGLESEDTGGRTYWFRPGAPPEPPPAPHALLLSIYDEFISSYKDWQALTEESFAKQMRAMGGDLTSIIIIDGRIRGTWKRWLRGGEVRVLLRPFTPLRVDERQAVERAAQEYARYLWTALVLDTQA